MTAKSMAKYEARARIVKAMAHPTRLFIVDILSTRERCVQELTRMIGADMSTVSKHLTVLKNVGILEDEKRGNQVFYKLSLPCAMAFFRCTESIMKSSTKKQMNLIR